LEPGNMRSMGGQLFTLYPIHLKTKSGSSPIIAKGTGRWRSVSLSWVCMYECV
jgi:hypothetical protein